jgi:hypothetical protein
MDGTFKVELPGEKSTSIAGNLMELDKIYSSLVKRFQSR